MCVLSVITEKENSKIIQQSETCLLFLLPSYDWRALGRIGASPDVAWRHYESRGRVRLISNNALQYNELPSYVFQICDVLFTWSHSRVRRFIFGNTSSKKYARTSLLVHIPPHNENWQTCYSRTSMARTPLGPWKFETAVVRASEGYY